MHCHGSYKTTIAEEIRSLKLENTSLQEQVADLKKICEDNLQLLQEADYTKNKAKEECARYWADKLFLYLKNASQGLLAFCARNYQFYPIK